MSLSAQSSLSWPYLLPVAWRSYIHMYTYGAHRSEILPTLTPPQSIYTCKECNLLIYSSAQRYSPRGEYGF